MSRLFFNTTVICQLLRDAFSDEAFEIFCQDHFPAVYTEISRGMSRSEKIRLLIDDCRQWDKFDQLLPLIEQENLAQYARYQPHLHDPNYFMTDPFAARRRDFYRHVSLPDRFVPRPEILVSLRESLLTGEANLALTSALKVDALHGMGGVGKSVLARALCDEPEIQARFCDGMLWVMLGQTPDLKAKLSEVIDKLGGVIRVNAPSEDYLKNELTTLLRDRACLLILDDVWQRSHVEAFRVVEAPHCRLLLTTRDAQIAGDLGFEPRAVPLLPEAEAMALLVAWAGSLDWLDEAAQRRVVKRLGFHPLALKLAGPQLRYYDSLETWLAEFKATELVALRVEDIHDSLSRTFHLSLARLTPAQRQLYNALAIFKEDEPIPDAAVERLWQGLQTIKPFQVQRLLDDLAARALLDWRDGQAGLHDLLRDFMTAELGEDGLIAAHQALLAAYRHTLPPSSQASSLPTLPSFGAAQDKSSSLPPFQLSPWPTAPDDGYLYNHLAYHLHAIADRDSTAAAELKSLFANDAWLHARVPQSNYDYDGYIADLMFAWQHAHKQCLAQIEAGQPPFALVDCIRYALIRTSINSLAANYVPELVARAVEVGLWPASRGLSIAAKIPDAEQRVKMLSLLLATGQLSQAQQVEAQQTGLEAVRAMKYEGHQAKTLVVLAPHLSDDLLATGLEVALALEERWHRAETLAALTPHLSGTAREQALAAGLEAALAMKAEWRQAQALAALAPHLSGTAREQALEAGLEAALAMKAEWRQAQALATLAPHLSGTTREHALAVGLEAVLAMKAEWRQAQALATLAPHLSGAACEQALAAALALKNAWLRARALAALAPQLGGAAREQALEAGLEAALAMKAGWLQAEVLATLAPYLSGTTLQRALTTGFETLLAIEDEESQAKALTALAPHLSGNLLAAGFEAALAIEDEESRAKALVALAPHLSNDLLKAGLDATLAIKTERFRAWVLAALAPHLNGDLLAVGLETALAIEDEESQAETLAALAPYLSIAAREQTLAVGLQAALAIKAEGVRARTLVTLASHLSRDLLAIGLDAAFTMENYWTKAKALAALAPYLDGAVREEALRAGLEAGLAIEDEESRAEVLAALAPYLDGAVREEALRAGLETALELVDESRRVRVIVTLAPHLQGTAREQALTTGLETALAINYGGDRAEVLAALAPYLDGVMREEALRAGLDAVWALEDEALQAWALTALAPHLSGNLLKAALDATLGLANEENQSWVLAALAPQLSNDLLATGLDAAQAMKADRPRAKALVALASHLSSDLIVAVLEVVLKLEDMRDRTESLVSLLPWIATRPDLIAQVQKATVQALWEQQNQKRTTVLAVLSTKGLFAPAIMGWPEASLAKITAAVTEIGQEWRWL